MRIGVHARNDCRFAEGDYRLLREARIETLKAMSHTSPETFARVRAEFPELEVIVRLYDDRIGYHAHPTPEAFVRRMAPIVLALQPYATRFEIHNEPNHYAEIEGWGASDADARDFLAWYMRVLAALRAACPWASFGFPGLAPNYPHRDLEWLAICGEAVRASDWLGCHCYWQYGNMLSDEWGLRFRLYHQRFPDRRIDITEFGDSTPELDPITMAGEYARYYGYLAGGAFPYLGSASAFIASSPDPQWAPFCWLREDGTLLPVVAAVGAIERGEPAFQIVDITRELPTDGSYPQRKAADIRFTVLHHAGTPNQDTIGSRLRVQRIAEYHIRRWGWKGIGYHFVIARDGTIYQTNPLSSVSNHASGANLRGVGVCLLGSYVREEPPREQVQAAAWLIQKLGYPWYDHKHWKGTACPGIAGDCVRREIG